MKILRLFSRYLILLFVLLLIGSILLLTAGLLPQKRIASNALYSLNQIEAELNTSKPGILDYENWACRLDVYTDFIIINQSYYMNTLKNPAYIFTNPQEIGGVNALHTSIEQQKDPNDTYARYWAGFRATVRLLLTFITYTQIRRMICIVFFLLAGGIAMHLHTRTKSIASAFAFLLTLGLLYPSIITATLQYSCCFLIAMAGLLLLPKREYKYLTYSMYFFILGAITQFFDFYTTPILTFGLPMLALLFISQHVDQQLSAEKMFRLSGRGFASWLVGYILMWIGKLSLTTIFTDLNALDDGFSAARDRIFFSTGNVDGSLIYRIGLVIWRVFIRVFDKPIYILVAAIGIFVVWLLLFIMRKKTKADLKSSVVYLAVACLPLVWFAVVSGPTIKASWFQYRGMGVFLFGVLLFVIQSTKKHSQVGETGTGINDLPQYGG